MLPDETPVSIDANKASCDKELSASPGRLFVRQSGLSRGFRGDSGLRRATPFADDFEGDLGHGCAARVKEPLDCWRGLRMRLQVRVGR